MLIKWFCDLFNSYPYGNNISPLVLLLAQKIYFQENNENLENSAGSILPVIPYLLTRGQPQLTIGEPELQSIKTFMNSVTHVHV